MSREKNRSWGGLRSFHSRQSRGDSPTPQEQRFFSKTNSAGVTELQRHCSGASSVDGSDLPPGSPGTPPKKVWEQKYRSFLHRKQKDDSSSVSSPASLDTRTLIPPKKNGFHDATAIEPPLVTTGSNRKVASNDNSSGSNLHSKGFRGGSPHNRTGGGEDSSVRGGKLFSNIFRRDKDNNDGYSRGSHKSLSSDELDGTMRRGVDKAYSPKTPQREMVLPQPTTSAARSTSYGSSLTPPLKAASNNNKNNHGLYRVSTTGHSMSPSSVQIQEPQTWSIHEARNWSLSESAATRGPPCIEDDDDDDSQGYGNLVPLVVSEPSLHDATMERSALSRAMEEDEPPETTNLLPAIGQEDDVGNSAVDRDELDLSSRKKAFTEFHNASDSDSAFLGDDSSKFHFQTARLYNQTPRKKLAAGHVSHNNLTPLERIASTQLEPVPENIEITKQRMLRPFVGVENWKAGRRYLVAPAVLAACPLDTSSLSSSWIFGDHHNRTSQSSVPRTVREAANSSAGTTGGGSIVLGNCLLSYTMTGNASITAKTWSRGSLVLRQNYLLEYDEITDQEDSSSHLVPKGEPRGYAHLECAVARPHPDFADALELDFYGSPCAKEDMRKLVIRLKERSERDSWVVCLNQASKFDLSCLYDIDMHSPDGFLGEGHYSTVHRATVRESNEVVALKIFDKNTFWKLVVKGRERADTLVRETSVQATLTAKCQSVAPFLRLRGFLETSQQVVLELELLGGTDLFRYISSKDGVVPENEAAQILSDVLTCLVTMNTSGVAHRDIKPSNLLMCDGGSDSPRVKVCDFGMSTFVGVDGHIRGRCGTPGYVAPEIFTTGLHGGYRNNVDVYSAGVTLYVMLCGYEPFYGESDEELVEANRQSKVEFPKEEWKNVSKQARDLVEKLMEKDSEKRPTAKEALQHVWLKTHSGPPGKRENGSIGVSNDDNCAIM